VPSRFSRLLQWADALMTKRVPFIVAALGRNVTHARCACQGVRPDFNR
jgi:hypothetical protein